MQSINPFPATKKGEASEGKGIKFITKVVVTTLVALPIIVIIGNLIKGKLTFKIPIFLTMLGIIIYATYRFIVFGEQSRRLEFEDFFLTIVVLAIAIAALIFLPKVAPSSYSLVLESIITSPVGVGLQSIFGGS